MSSSQPSRKQLPARPSEENLKKQAKGLSRREHLRLADAQHRLADEYGFSNWAELMRAVGNKHEAVPSNAPLWLVCQSTDPDEVRLAEARRLIESGARIQQMAADGSTALHQSARRGPIQMVELLLGHGAKEWLDDHQGKKPIDYARQGTAADKEEIVKLLDRPVIRDPLFKSAVKAIHNGDLATLNKLLADHPNLVHDRAVEPDCYPPTYFSNPKLLWFVADNPNLIETMPTNTLEITQAIIDAGAEREDMDYTLELVATSSPAREQHFQQPLMNLLMKSGARATENAVYMTLGHWELSAVQVMLDAGQPMTAPIAAGMGQIDSLKKLLPAASNDEKHAALSMAVINRQWEAARLCLDAGADVNRFLLVHAHSLPVHQAAVNDDVPMLKLLVERGAKLNIRDTLWNATPLGWAIHTKKRAAEAYLRSVNGNEGDDENNQDESPAASDLADELKDDAKNA